MAMVRAATSKAEAELARHLLSRLGAELQRHTKGLSIALEARSPGAAFGRHESLLTIDDGRSHRSTLRLTPRHSEILLLLASTPRGLSGDELAVLLYREDNSASTLRAELNRLRSLLVDDLLASRPYRPVAEVTADGWRSRLISLQATSLLRRRRTEDRCLHAPWRQALSGFAQTWRFRCGKRFWSTGSQS